jgi:hypothetical protein
MGRGKSRNQYGRTRKSVAAMMSNWAEKQRYRSDVSGKGREVLDRIA